MNTIVYISPCDSDQSWSSPYSYHMSPIFVNNMTPPFCYIQPHPCVQNISSSSSDSAFTTASSAHAASSAPTSSTFSSSNSVFTSGNFSASSQDLVAPAKPFNPLSITAFSSSPSDSKFSLLPKRAEHRVSSSESKAHSASMIYGTEECLLSSLSQTDDVVTTSLS